jgi:carbamoyl-phosphate synthase large subunit
MSNLKKLNIGVTGTGSLVGQAIIKSIKASELYKNSNLIGMDYFENTIGSYWCDYNFILPDLLDENLYNEWEQKLFQIIIDSKIEILFIGVDFELIKFSNLKKEIEIKTNCKVVVSDKRVIEIADDKYLTYKFLKENGLSFPVTYNENNIEFSELIYPCILKPRNGYRSRGVYKIESEKELLEKIQTIKDPIVQELIGTENTEYTCGIIYLDKLEEIIVLRRDLKEGNTSVAYYEENVPKNITSYLEGIANTLKPYGACNLQLRVDKDGIPKMFEINARHSGTTYMRTIFGFNEIEIIIAKLMKIDTPSIKLKEGKVIRYFDEMFIPKKS